jgi:SEC-C motif-containing protein
MSACPCGSKHEFDACCGPILAGTPAPTAEALVRARYTAFARRELDYVDRTHAPEVRADFNRAEAERVANECRFLSLRIHRAEESGDTAEVEFVTHLRRGPSAVNQSAVSLFRREGGEWFYTGPKRAPQAAPVHVEKHGRNDPCPCGSGKKYKKCCALSEPG